MLSHCDTTWWIPHSSSGEDLLCFYQVWIFTSEKKSCHYVKTYHPVWIINTDIKLICLVGWMCMKEELGGADVVLVQNSYKWLSEESRWLYIGLYPKKALFYVSQQSGGVTCAMCNLMDIQSFNLWWLCYYWQNGKYEPFAVTLFWCTKLL